MLGSLVAITLNANAYRVSKSISSHIKIVSATQLYDLVKKTKPNQVATNLGNPDEMITLNRDFPLVPNFQWKPLEQHIDLIGI